MSCCVQNPVGVKVGPTTDPVELLQLLERLDPNHEPGKVVLITRFGVFPAEHDTCTAEHYTGTP